MKDPFGLGLTIPPPPKPVAAPVMAKTESVFPVAPARREVPPLATSEIDLEDAFGDLDVVDSSFETKLEITVPIPVPVVEAPKPLERRKVAEPPANGEALLREALSQASREVIERVVWEVVPQLAETMIREELDRLIKEREAKK